MKEDGHNYTFGAPKGGWPNFSEKSKTAEPRQWVIYVAGPMRGYKGCNFAAFEKATVHLRSQGFDVISPAEEDEKVYGVGYTAAWERCDGTEADADYDMLEIIQRDIGYVLECDAIVLIPAWQDSKGAQAELAVARWAGLRVGYMKCVLSGTVNWETQ